MREDLKNLEDKFGKEYIDALYSVLNIREDRLNQYGNTYLDDDYLFLYYQVLNKMKRFSLQLDRESGVEKIKDLSVALDSAIDCANYAIFIVAKILKNTDE
jgi:hypothetical protein